MNKKGEYKLRLKTGLRIVLINCYVRKRGATVENMAEFICSNFVMTRTSKRRIRIQVASHLGGDPPQVLLFKRAPLFKKVAKKKKPVSSKTIFLNSLFRVYF